MSLSDDPTMVELGMITAPVGLKGEMRMTIYSGEADNLHIGTELYIDGHDQAEVVSLRFQKCRPVIRLDGIESIEQAEAMRGLPVFISEDDLAELPEGEHYFRDLIGLRVYDRTAGCDVGALEDIIDNPAQNIYVVRDDSGREVMIPAVDAFVKEIDIDGGIIYVELIEGML